MRDVLPTMQAWMSESRDFAVARVVQTWGSAPRRPGAAMLVSSSGDVAGSVSGGCIEGAVIQEAMQCLANRSRKLLTFGVDTETAWSVGLACGGEISVLVQPFEPASPAWTTAIDLIAGGEGCVMESWINEAQDNATAASGPLGTALDDSAQRFVHYVPPRARLLIVGAVDIAVHLTALASRLDFEVTIIDPRAVFTRADRFDIQPDAVHTAWPQEVMEQVGPDAGTFAVLLTHNPKIDDPALHALLNSKAAYIGALGGRKTQAVRRERLIKAGFSEEDVARIHGPVGLSIGAATPAEIAVSVLAEIISVQRAAG